jgi:hypothetical protein
VLDPDFFRKATVALLLTQAAVKLGILAARAMAKDMDALGG